jgi:hypothetical protein
MTKEQVQQIFEDHFRDKYPVKKMSSPFRDFFVEKSAFVAVAVKLEQTEKETRFVYNGFSPRWWARALLGALIGPMMSGGLTKEVKELLETGPQFQ